MLKITNLRCKDLKEALGISRKELSFSWILESDFRNTMQTAYQIKVGERQTVIWNSQVVKGDQSTYVPYQGAELKSRGEYWWQVTVWDNHGQKAESEKMFFEIALEQNDFLAKWIEPDLPPIRDEPEGSMLRTMYQALVPQKNGDPGRKLTPCSYLRKEFVLNDEIEKARMYITAHGVYRASINGESVDTRLLAPEFDSYNEQLLFQTYDVTASLRKGRNVVGVVIADGWWGGRIHFVGASCFYGNRHGLLLQIEIICRNGNTEIITSDEQFRCSTGPFCYSDLFIGEKYDANREMTGWDLPGYRTDHWKKVLPAEYALDNLYPQENPPIKIIKSFHPKEILTTPRGETVIDVGQVMAGKIRIRIQAPKNTEITFQHSELLDEDGNYLHNIMGRNKQQLDTYICRGEGEEVYEPVFTYHGFRYVKVVGYPGVLTTEHIDVLVIASDNEETGSFSCSNQLLNQLQSNIYWSQISNFISIPTDCPQREKDGWTGDIGVYAPTALYLQDNKAFLEKWLRDLIAEQRESGSVPDAVPINTKGPGRGEASAGWGDAAVLVPWALYRSSGDIRILQLQYESMKRWVAFEERKAAEKNPAKFEHSTKYRNSPELQKYSKYLWNTGKHYGDWLIPSMVKNNPLGADAGAKKTGQAVATAYFANSAHIMKQVSEILGDNKSAAHYDALYKNICRAFTLCFLEEDGTIQPEFQGIYVMALKFDLIPKEYRKKCTEKLLRLIVKNDGCLDTGFLSVGHILDVLTKEGHIDAAYKLLYNDKCPSWLYEVKMGATTLWENWNSISEDGKIGKSSYNHYAFGCVGEWMYRNIGGLEMIEPGYKKFRVRPRPDETLTMAALRYRSVYGEIAVEWKKKDGKMILKVNIPANTQAEVILMDGSMRVCGSGEYVFDCFFS